jgi:serine/threonine protein kinase
LLESKIMTTDRYEIINEIGRGNFGKTYLALDRHQGDNCVLKALSPLRYGTPAHDAVAFKNEALILGSLSHDQIPKFRDRCTVNLPTGAAECIAMDLVDGKSYARVMGERSATFSEKEANDFLLALLPVLEYIHSVGIVHDGISPKNIVQRASDDKPCLIDFGASSMFPGRVPAWAAKKDLSNLGNTALIFLTGEWDNPAPPDSPLGNLLKNMGRYSPAKEVLSDLLKIQNLSEAPTPPNHAKFTGATPIKNPWYKPGWQIMAGDGDILRNNKILELAMGEQFKFAPMVSERDLKNCKRLKSKKDGFFAILPEGTDAEGLQITIGFYLHFAFAFAQNWDNILYLRSLESTDIWLHLRKAPANGEYLTTVNKWRAANNLPLAPPSDFYFVDGLCAFGWERGRRDRRVFEVVVKNPRTPTPGSFFIKNAPIWKKYYKPKSIVFQAEDEQAQRLEKLWGKL